MNYVGIAVTSLPEAAESTAAILEENAERFGAWYDGDAVFFWSALLPLHDRDDHGSEIFVQHADIEGYGLSVFAPNCDSAAELERRLIRALSMDYVLDDSDEAVLISPRTAN
jgi:hypothetical protein